MRFFKDLSPAAVAAGFVAVLVGFTSSVALVFQAAQAFHATPEQITSWIWALGLGMGLCSLVPSLILRMPVMVAWSTPGAAVLATAGLAGGFSMGEAIGAFIVSAALIILVGVTGWFERIMNRIPMEIASALLAGVLAKFGMQAFSAAETNLSLVLVMLLAYLLSRRMTPRYAVIITLLAGGMLETIRYNGGIDFIISRLTRHVSGKRGAEFSIAALVGIANLCTANNTIAIITTGPIAKDIALRFHLDRRKTASILDTFSCLVQGIIPYGAQMLIASGLAGISPISIIGNLYYPFCMGACAILAILLRYPRKYSGEG